MYRVLFYCHNVEGLGHITRTLRVAKALAEIGDVDVAIITGCRFLDVAKAAAPEAKSVFVWSLPPLINDGTGALRGVDGMAQEAVVAQRKQLILDLSRAWEPDAFIADHNPAGLLGELWPTLDAARREGWPTAFIWGARDVWDSPELHDRLQRRIRQLRLSECLHQYSAVMAYTDADWIDTLAFYRQHLSLPALAQSVGFVVGRTVRRERDPKALPTVLVAMGGGATGDAIASCAWHALSELICKGDLSMRIVRGPLAPWILPGDLQEAIRLGSVEIIDCAPIEAAVQSQALVVATSGYGTAYTLASTNSPLVLMPIPSDGEEQAYRARLLTKLEAVWSVERRASADVTTVLRDALLHAGKEVRRFVPFSTSGAEAAAAFVHSLLVGNRPL